MRHSRLVLPLLLVMTGSSAYGAPRPVAPARTFELDLNVPAYRLDVFDGGVRTQRYRVAVGMPRHRTPRGSYQITSIEWNPWWIPPDREWARNERPEPPGPSNPMGRVKLNFLPLYFLHGTPLERSLGGAASHGCVRLSNTDAIALALRVHSVGTPDLDHALLDSLVADTSFTRLIPLEFPVPIRIRYDLAEIDDDTLFLYRDIYSLDQRRETQRALDVLSSAGLDPARIDLDQLQKSIRSTSRRPLRIPLRSLVIPSHTDTTGPGPSDAGDSGRPTNRRAPRVPATSRRSESGGAETLLPRTWGCVQSTGHR